MSSYLQQIQGQKALRKESVQREKLGPKNSPALSFPPGASQLPTLSPCPDLAAVYSETAIRNGKRIPGQRRCPRAAPDWLGPNPAHYTTRPRLRGSPLLPSLASGFSAACRGLSSGLSPWSCPSGTDQETEAHQKGKAACPWTQSPLKQKLSRIAG